VENFEPDCQIDSSREFQRLLDPACHSSVATDQAGLISVLAPASTEGYATAFRSDYDQRRILK
jgi:hypothetical protein